jgi:hypothetical protein
MRVVWRVGCAVGTAVAAIACSGTSTGSGVGGGGGAACQKGEVKISGTIGGVIIDQRYTFRGIVLNQISTPKTATVTIEGGGQVALQWDALTATGQTTAARGNLLMPDGPLAGENVCFGTGSTVTLLDNAGTFVVKTPSKGTSCPGSATTGELQGCWSK